MAGHRFTDIIELGAVIGHHNNSSLYHTVKENAFFAAIRRHNQGNGWIITGPETKFSIHHFTAIKGYLKASPLNFEGNRKVGKIPFHGES